MVSFNMTPPTKKAVIQKILEIQSSTTPIPEGSPEDYYYISGMKHGSIMALMDLFKITEQDFR